AVGSDASASFGSLNITGVDTTVDDTMAFYVNCFDGGDGTPFSVSGSGWSKSDEITADLGDSGSASGSWGTKHQATAGATGTVAVNGNSSDGRSGFQFAVAPFVEPPPDVTYEQSGYRVFENANSTDVGAALATSNT